MLVSTLSRFVSPRFIASLVSSSRANLQLAKAYGAYVVTTCSPSSRELVEGLSPDDILDYKESDLIEQLATKYGDKPFDIVFDTVGHNSNLYYKSPKFLKVRRPDWL